MNHLRRILTVMPLLLLSACVVPMQAQNYSEAFVTTWQASDRFIVRYRPNPASTEPTVTDLALLYSAETALQQGFPYFVVVSEADIGTRRGQQAPITSVAAEPGSLYRHASPAATNRIIGYHDRPPGFHYVALFVKASLRARYDLDRTGGSI